MAHKHEAEIRKIMTQLEKLRDGIVDIHDTLVDREAQGTLEYPGLELDEVIDHLGDGLEEFDEAIETIETALDPDADPDEEDDDEDEEDEDDEEDEGDD